MMQRILSVWTIVLAVAGIFVLLAMMLCGRSVSRAATTGPLWRRKLLTAAMVLLGMSGLGGCEGKKDRPPVVTRDATSRPIAPKLESLEDIGRELDLIERQIAAGEVSRDVLEKLLDHIADTAYDIVIMKGTATPGSATAPTKDPLVDAQARASKLWASLRAAAPSEPDHGKDWQAVLAFWHFVKPRMPEVTTKYQREVAGELQQAARLGLEALSRRGVLDPGESRLLMLESDRLLEDIAESPPVDWNVTCYVMAPVTPARDSMNRLLDRVDLLETALKDGCLAPAVAQRVLDNIRSDMKVLSDPKEFRQLNKAEQAKAKAVAKRMDALLKRLAPSEGRP